MVGTKKPQPTTMLLLELAPVVSRNVRLCYTRISGCKADSVTMHQTETVVGRVCYFEHGRNGLKRSRWRPISVPAPQETRRQRLERSCELTLRRGGTIWVHLGLIRQEDASDIAREAKESGLFRRYKIQGGYEPRVHYLLHDKATNDFQSSPQPGYRYGSLTMKARPLRNSPSLQRLSRKLAHLAKVAYFNIGVDVVLYRAEFDSIGKHADNKQGEDCVFSVIVQSPNPPRRIVIEPKVPQVGDEVIELLLGVGDGYRMDMAMQTNYYHSVPKWAPNQNRLFDQTNQQRMVIVLRHGNEVHYKTDGGEAVTKIGPQAPTRDYTIGEGIDGLTMNAQYTRAQLVSSGIHRSSQKGVSGNSRIGCDAIIVSGQADDDSIEDTYFTLRYSAQPRNGGMALLQSIDDGKGVRVLRSSNYDSVYRAEVPPLYTGPALYRYDGIYNIVDFLLVFKRGLEPWISFTLHKMGEERMIEGIHDRLS